MEKFKPNYAIRISTKILALMRKLKQNLFRYMQFSV